MSEEEIDIEAEEELVPEPEPRLYEHDCENCIFLGMYRGHDLYYHPAPNETVIARWGNEGGEYYSGIHLAMLARGSSAEENEDQDWEPPEGAIHLLAVAKNRYKHSGIAHERALK